MFVGGVMQAFVLFWLPVLRGGHLGHFLLTIQVRVLLYYSPSNGTLFLGNSIKSKMRILY